MKIEVPDHIPMEAMRSIAEVHGLRMRYQSDGSIRMEPRPARPVAGNGNVVPMPHRRRQYTGADITAGPGPDGGAA